ncbi:ABC transporter ATP-binding protein [Streptosporangium roseum]|uniref:Oligopeptide/dipeptide ABC transporter, ATPase subunit n=1 Tax=Streptosporangium roseum (strain ATCC 12428 / DSM 43021 / JCM 3005 / KCTC 9067 / NCIMB 10171 / NRRL 2505 / NI 9100) TaxID=479432 RepID=D2BFI0_STRRD|nr:ABC transporter ATP-binding protein [Streptosporangium roseum]ACZ88338.1 oligopeptide/dipeptide ABC transporter, ATPase subunit [Streptosporangium roseum DSM 43021]
MIRVVGLRAETGGSALVDGVSFELAAGRVLALVGASGSGKTTIGRALLGEHAPGVALSGTVEVGGRIGYLPQHPASVLNPVRRVGAVLREIARRHAPDGAAAERVASVLRRAGLPTGEDLLRRYPHQLSGGQQQRLVLAQTLLTAPSAIVADEPTTGQDAVTRGEVVDELRGLAGQGIAVVLLSHDLDVVRALADQVVVLRGGRVAESGHAEDVFTRPAHDYTRRLLAARLPATPLPVPAVPSPAPAGIPPGPAAPPGRVRIEVAGLTAGHRSGPVLDDVSLRVAAGQCLALVGRSGSGKTTLARCVAGLHEPARGTVLLDGRPLAPSLSRRRREDVARVQYVFQDAHASFDPGRTVAEQVSRTAIRLRGLGPGQAREAALDMLGRVGLGPAAAARRPGGLSGGELQRAALARALLASPDVLICDEITSGLDTVTQAGVLDLLDGLRRALGLTLVLISHDMGVVARLADHVVILSEGRIAEEGGAAHVLARPRHPLTRALLDRHPHQENQI